MFETIASGLVYRNPQPHLKSIHAWHPSLVQLDSGELIASFDLGEAVEALDYRTYLARSQDEGATWSEPARWFRDEFDARTSHSVRLGRAADGTLIGVGGRLYRDNPELGVVNRDNFGYTRMDLVQLTSGDGGRSWNGPQTITPPLVGPAFETCHCVVELADGRWLYPTSTWKGWNGEAPNGMKSVALVSHDRGRSWSEYLDIIDDYAAGNINWEVSLVQLPDGRLLAVTWVVNEKSGQTLPTQFTISRDGRSFAPPRPNGLRGQTAKVLALRDGRVLCLYRRHDRPGLWADLARIEGDDWRSLSSQPLWQGAASGMRGEGNSIDELSSLKFGYPSMVELPSGDVLAVFWCVEDEVYGILWIRIRVHG